ncbi:MAG: hypothetical protein U5R30_18260 [Deltaproteobacteria bacterium]|nr:hypothetical protein [Deltaproteobacteria bacterium]
MEKALELLRRQRKIDTHVHSTASDGTLTPAQNRRPRLRRNALSGIAITDHDTIDGAREALRIGLPPRLHFLTGMELSAAPPAFLHRSGSFHILGYGLRLDDDELNHTLLDLQRARGDANFAIIERLPTT